MEQALEFDFYVNRGRKLVLAGGYSVLEKMGFVVLLF